MKSLLTFLTLLSLTLTAWGQGITTSTTIPYAARSDYMFHNVVLVGDSIPQVCSNAVINALTNYFVYSMATGGETAAQANVRHQNFTNGYDYTTIIWVGHNDLPDTNAAKAGIAAIAARQNNKNFIILTLLNRGDRGIGTSFYTNTIDVNTWITNTYPNNSYDIRTYMHALTNGSAQDDTDYANDCVPTSLRVSVNDIHPNADGQLVVANKLYELLTAKKAALPNRSFSYSALQDLFAYPPPATFSTINGSTAILSTELSVGPGRHPSLSGTQTYMPAIYLADNASLVTYNPTDLPAVYYTPLGLYSANFSIYFRHYDGANTVTNASIAVTTGTWTFYSTNGLQLAILTNPPAAPPAGMVKIYAVTNAVGGKIVGVMKFSDDSTNAFATQP